VGPAGRGRQQGRRQRHTGRRIGGARQARRAHHLRHLGDDPGRQSRDYDKLSYDPVDSFEAITRMGTSPFVLLVDRNSPINTAAELTARLKAEPGKHNYGAGALPARVASELYKMAAGVEAVYVGYKSNPQAIPDLQSGRCSPS
jgi:tripartite-type tricarboxylate transporter receptor subunit TctC